MLVLENSEVSMFVSEGLGVNEQGHLTIAGKDAVSIASEYGTPVYVMDEALIRKTAVSFASPSKNIITGPEWLFTPAKHFAVKRCAGLPQKKT